MSYTSVIRYVRALDSAATDGSGKTGLAFGDITAKYLVQGGTLTALTPETITTLGTYQAPTDATHIRIKELSSSDPCKGVYEVHFHNTQVANTGKRLWLFLSAGGAAFQPLELDLADALPTDAISAAALSAAAANKIADHSRRRTQANVEASSDGDAIGKTSLYGLIQQNQNASFSSTTLTVKKTDGSTTLGTFTLTVSGSDITGIG